MMASWVLGLLLCLVAQPALARVERFAIVVGNNHGVSGDLRLRYAEDDAARVYDVLTELGDFPAQNMVLLRGRDAGQVREALLSVNERIRELRADPSAEVVLFFYYSGHADAQALRLGGTKFHLAELRQHARGSAANFRLVVLDACRSGSLTQVKGGQRGPPFAIDPQDPESERLPSDGFAFLTATSANEDAQESDELRGAFFTHALIAGLMGAADLDADGVVVLDEVYRYAYATTLRATSRTFAGTQHPTFHYQLRGRDKLVLTRPHAYAGKRANVDLPEGLGLLLMREHADGAVVVELEPSSRRRRLSLQPGRYFVRARAPDVLFEGTLDARAGQSQQIDTDALVKIEYARLVRRGARRRAFAHSAEAGPSVRSSLQNSGSACIGGFASYGLDLTAFGLRARVGTCRSGFETRTVRAVVMAYDLELVLHHAWDLRYLTLLTGLGAGLTLFEQRFDAAGSAPSHRALFPFMTLGIAVRAALGGGFFCAASMDGQTHFLRLKEVAPGSDYLRIDFAVRGTLGVGKEF